MIPLFIALAATAAATIAVVAGRRRDATRTEALRELAERLGWGFRREVEAKALPDLERFELLSQGRRRTLNNVMTSPESDVRVVVFDYAYTTGAGNSRRRHRQTVAYVVSGTFSLPTFSVRPQHFGHAIAKVFGYQDVEVPERPRFSEMFVLRGEDEAALRGVFGARELAQFFEERDAICAAGTGRELLLWRPGRRADVSAIEALIGDARELADLVARS